MPSITYRDVQFAYQDHGKGPAIVFLHGFLESQIMWAELAKGFPASFRKITLDLPGHGQSGNLGYVHSMEDMAEVVHELLQQLKIKKAFLIGHSMGGYVSLAFAERYPDMVRKLVLLNSTARADSKEKKVDRDRAIKLVKENHRSFIRTAVPLLFRSKNRRNLREEVSAVKKEALKTSKQGVIAALEGMKIRMDREVLLHFAPYPVLLIAGKNDPVIRMDQLEDQLSAANVVPVITENGHMGHIEDKEEVLRALKSFIKT